jgi:sulfur transfer complex TusBCD TusB component (DsrH family)
MKRFISSHLFALTILIGTACFAQGPNSAESNKAVPASTASDTIDVQHVIDAYHEAVLNHDGPRLASLFIPQGSMWLNVISDDTYARAKAKSPDAVKVHVGSYTDFVKLVSTSKASFNPTPTHLQQNSDGTIASVYFDTSYS